VKLENTIMFSGESCYGCEFMKDKMDRGKIQLQEIIDVSTNEGMHKAMKYRVQSLPAFVNTLNCESIIGTTSIKKLTELNQM
jgi:hypothetical protein